MQSRDGCIGWFLEHPKDLNKKVRIVYSLPEFGSIHSQKKNKKISYSSLILKVKQTFKDR